jgi:hypothetical protein
MSARLSSNRPMNLTRAQLYQEVSLRDTSPFATNRENLPQYSSCAVRPRFRIAGCPDISHLGRARAS